MSVFEMDEQGVRLDLSINLGQILTAVAMLISVVSAYWALSTQIALNEARVANNEMAITNQQHSLSEAIKVLGDIKTDIAVIRYRFDERRTDQIQGR